LAYLQLAVAILLNASGQLLLKRASMTGGDEAGATAMVRPYLSVWFILGVLSLGLSSLLWVRVLKKVPLTLAHPITGIVFVIVPLISHLLWKEALPPTRLAGILIITLGVLLVAKDGM
jgi:multidrug transporter EmrE-like cation transporter